MTVVLTAAQIAWVAATTAPDERAAWFGAGDPDVIALYNPETGETSYAGMLQNTVVGAERFPTHEAALAHAAAQRDVFAARGATAGVTLPVWLTDRTVANAVATQEELQYTVDDTFDLRSQYLEYDNPYREMGTSTLVDLLADFFDPAQRHDPSVQPLLDAVTPHTRAILIDGKRARGEDEELVGSVCESWRAAGFYGYLVGVSMPIRRYTADSTTGFSFSQGIRRCAVLYVSSLDDRTPMETWARAQVESFLAARAA